MQCKHTSSAKYDGYKAIQKVYSARLKYSDELNKNIESLIFATNAKMLSTKTKKLAEQYSVNIVSYNEIANMLDIHIVTFEMVLNRLGKKRLKIG